MISKLITRILSLLLSPSAPVTSLVLGEARSEDNKIELVPGKNKVGKKNEIVTYVTSGEPEA